MNDERIDEAGAMLRSVMASQTGKNVLSRAFALMAQSLDIEPAIEPQKPVKRILETENPWNENRTVKGWS